MSYQDPNEIVFEEKQILSEKEENSSAPKNLDIFQHLKLNIKRTSLN